MAVNSTSVKPLEYAKETILGMTIALEQRFGCTPRNDVGTTLNTKFGVLPSRLPVNERLIKYFCWGVGGRVNDGEFLSSARPVLGTNMSLYDMRPFRAVPEEDDLSDEERANYAMRVVTPINGTSYALYYLKKIEFSQSQVQYTRTDPVSGIVTAYTLDYSNLDPTAPVADDNGIITDVADQVSVVLPGTITITGREVLESMAVMDGGDPRYAIVSELGFVSASTESVSAVDFNNDPFSYQEAILAQMVDQYNFVGQPFLSTSDSWSRTMSFSAKNLINQS
jgi:hypothetical protein